MFRLNHFSRLKIFSCREKFEEFCRSSLAVKNLLLGTSSSTPSSVRKFKKKDKAAMAFKVKTVANFINLIITLGSRPLMLTRMDFWIKTSFPTLPEQSLQSTGTDFSPTWIKMETEKLISRSFRFFLRKNNENL